MKTRSRGSLLARQFNQVMVVGEEKHLGLSRELCQGVQGCRCAIIVETQQDVIHDEGNRLVRLEP